LAAALALCAAPALAGGHVGIVLLPPQPVVEPPPAYVPPPPTPGYPPPVTTPAPPPPLPPQVTHFTPPQALPVIIPDRPTGHR